MSMGPYTKTEKVATLLSYIDRLLEMAEAGKPLTTTTGRQTAPFPQMEKTLIKYANKVFDWLYTEAKAEANSRFGHRSFYNHYVTQHKRAIEWKHHDAGGAMRYLFFDDPNHP